MGGPAEIEQLLQAREPLYRACADLAVDTAGRSPEDVVEDILSRVRNQGSGVRSQESGVRNECPDPCPVTPDP
jgi:hypothetical protein